MKRRAALIAACVAFAAMFAVAGCSEEEKAKADVPVVSEPDVSEPYVSKNPNVDIFNK